METVGIPIAFVVISSILLWFVIGSKGNWFVKVCVIAATLLFSLVIWNSLEGIQGWPTKDELPAKFLLHWAVVVEDNKDTKEPGAIYLWVKDVEEKENANWFSILPKDITKSPRVYKIPYSRKTHEQLQKAIEGIKKGKRYVGENKGKGEIGEEGEGKEGKGKGKDGKGKDGYPKDGKGKDGNGEFDFSQEQDLIFHELPPSLLPPKEPEETTQLNDPFAPGAAPAPPPPPQPPPQPPQTGPLIVPDNP